MSKSSSKKQRTSIPDSSSNDQSTTEHETTTNQQNSTALGDNGTNSSTVGSANVADTVENSSRDETVAPSPNTILAALTTSASKKKTLNAEEQRKMFTKPKKSTEGGEGDKKPGWFSKTTNQVRKHQSMAGSLSPQMVIEKMVRAPFDPYNMKIDGPKYPDVVPCFVEVSKESRNKYEWDHDLGVLTLDRVLHSAVYYPHNYGFIPQTLCGDGDPLDILVMSTSPLVPGCVVFCRPICYMVMEDEKGMDEKVLAVNAKDAHYADIKTMKDLHEHTLREIAEFFATYKKLEKDKWAKVGGWRGTEDTITLIKESHENYKKQFDAAMLEPATSDS